MTTKTHTFALLVAAVLLAFAGCADLQSDLPTPTSPGAQIPGHDTGWIDPAASNFHGTLLKADNQKINQCKSCHGSDLSGGNTGVACAKCHAHPQGWITPTSSSFHGKAIQLSGWKLQPCKGCHGSTYAGGILGGSCLTCHNKPGGPENCTTCHGSGNNPAPPKDVSGNTDPTARAVGAHRVHLAGILACAECHKVPSSLYDAGHVDNPAPAELLIKNALASTPTNVSGTSTYSSSLPTYTPAPVYDPGTIGCKNTYCHGYFKNGNTTYAPVWNKTSPAQAACGTCHGDVSKPTQVERALPKIDAQGGTHPNSTLCFACHAGVVDQSGAIIDSTKHMNGKLNLFGNEQNF